MNFFDVSEKLMMTPMQDNFPLAAMFPTPEKIQDAARDMMALSPFGDTTAFEQFMPKMGELPEFPMMDNIPTMRAPVGGAAAGSALACAVAAQAYGTFFGAVTGAMGAASKLAKSEYEGPRPPATLPNFLTFEWLPGSETSGSDAKAEEAPSPAKAVKRVSKPTSAPKSQPKARVVAPAVEAPVETVADLPANVVDAPVANTTAEATPMPEDFVKPQSIERPENPDDLKLISGVGPKMEKALNGLGIWTFAQVSGWTSNEAAWMDDYLQSRGRIERDDWIGQASALSNVDR